MRSIVEASRYVCLFPERGSSLWRIYDTKVCYYSFVSVQNLSEYHFKRMFRAHSQFFGLSRCQKRTHGADGCSGAIAATGDHALRKRNQRTGVLQAQKNRGDSKVYSVWVLAGLCGECTGRQTQFEDGGMKVCVCMYAGKRQNSDRSDGRQQSDRKWDC